MAMEIIALSIEHCDLTKFGGCLPEGTPNPRADRRNSRDPMSPSNYSWLVVYLPPLKKYDILGWDDEIPDLWKQHVPNHQPELIKGHNCNVAIAILNHPPNHHFYGWDSKFQPSKMVCL